MAANSSEENHGESVSPNGSVQNSGFLSSTMTSLSDDRNSADSMDKKNQLVGELLSSPNASITTEANRSSVACPDTPTSKKGSDVREKNENKISDKEEEGKKEGNRGCGKFGQVFSAPLNLEAEQSAMQQQIVDMYMRSMQQFTDSLAKMKLPMDLDKPESEDRGDLIQDNDDSVDVEKKKKDGSRVFYGSRAFF